MAKNPRPAPQQAPEPEQTAAPLTPESPYQFLPPQINDNVQPPPPVEATAESELEPESESESKKADEAGEQPADDAPSA